MEELKSKVEPIMIEEKKKYKRLPISESGELLNLGNIRIKSPRNLVIVKYPKSGSTKSMVNVPKMLIIDTENGTEDFSANNKVNLLDASIEDNFIKTKKYGYIPQAIYDVVMELYIANKMKDYWELKARFDMERDLDIKQKMYQDLLKMINEMPFPICCIDTITALVNISNKAALFEYNLNMKLENQKADIKRINEYGGVQEIRRKFGEIKRFFEQNAAPFIIFSGHIALKKKVLKKSDEDISALDIALEGVLSTIFTAQADSVCTFYRDEKGCFLDFHKKDMETDLGSRPMHLANRLIKIADLLKDDEENPKTYWGIIFPEIIELQNK